MTYEQVIELGWADRYPKEKQGQRTFKIVEEGGKWILGICFKLDEEGFHNMVIVGWIDKEVKSNMWENMETNFYGSIKTQEDLKNIMRYVGVIEY